MRQVLAEKPQEYESEKSPRSGPGSAAASGGREDEAVLARRGKLLDKSSVWS